MAFAAARMLKEKKEQENRKRSTGISHSTSRTMNKVDSWIIYFGCLARGNTQSSCSFSKIGNFFSLDCSLISVSKYFVLQEWIFSFFIRQGNHPVVAKKLKLVLCVCISALSQASPWEGSCEVCQEEAEQERRT